MDVVPTKADAAQLAKTGLGPLYRSASLSLWHWLQVTERCGSLIRAFTGDLQVEAQVHYPQKDFVDLYSGTQCYYHCHRGDVEHGHVHLFRRPIPDGPISHLIAISLDNRGLPVGLFTVNRWVSADHWLSAGKTLKLLNGVTLRSSGCDPHLSLWLIYFLRFYRKLISELLWERDRYLVQNSGGLHQMLEDQNLEILSSRTIDWGSNLAAVEAQFDSITHSKMRP